MYFLKNVFLIVLVEFVCIQVTYAGVNNDVPSCYQSNKMGVPPPPAVELFVFIDQTTILDLSLKKSVFDNVGRMLQPGSAFTIGRFSSFNQGRYSEILASGVLEAQIEPGLRDDIGVKLLRNFDSCMEKQMRYGAAVVWKAVNTALGGSMSDLAKSDVMASLRDFSARVRQSPAKEKVVLIASDMLENSSVSSFYAKRSVREVDSAKELAAARKAGLIGDFGGAHIYIMGAGTVSEDTKISGGVYRSPNVMLALSRFWIEYFTESGAVVKEIGQPALLMPIK